MYGYGVVGDSITRGAQQPLRRQFGAGGYVNGAPGQTIRQQFDALRNFVAHSAADAPITINLGTNDVFRGTRAAGNIRRALDILGGQRQINWVNVRTNGVTPYYGRNWQQRATHFNNVLGRIAGNRDNVDVVDWASQSRGHRDWFQGDGLNPNQMGSRYYAQYLRNTQSAVSVS